MGEFEVQAGVGNPEQVISVEGHRPELSVSAAEVVFSVAEGLFWGAMAMGSGMEEGLWQAWIMDVEVVACIWVYCWSGLGWRVGGRFIPCEVP